VLLIELVAYTAYRLKFGDYDRQELQLERIQTINKLQQGPAYTAEDFAGKSVVVKEKLHPYFGYVIDGKLRTENCASDDPQECYSRIKVSTDKPFVRRAPDKLIVGLLGGSVAVGTSSRGVGTLYKEFLGQLPEYRDREVILYTMASGGFRQPQQLMMLNFYISLGAEFDLILNLDGFNDVAIPASQWALNKLHPSFPRSWNHRVANRIPDELLEHLAKKKSVQRNHIAFATFMANPIARNSSTFNLVWQLKHQNSMKNISEIDVLINGVETDADVKRDFRYEALGPDYEFTDWKNLYSYSVNIWANSSKLVDSIADGGGAKYFHFLQPNQYIEGSKPMSVKERDVALMKQGGYGYHYKQAYPHIIEKAKWLTAQGVKFHDLTNLYQDVEEPIYIDNCCHVNGKGSRLMVKEMANIIHQSNQSTAD
jgi:hypothetical protein